ncbi:hypothetical protein BDD12DRAFT_901306 [Trichophaea hybrida]|nr:hypothetical protein BDD12DRAFT_901306 [Trichophaea hybrida]
MASDSTAAARADGGTDDSSSLTSPRNVGSLKTQKELSTPQTSSHEHISPVDTEISLTTTPLFSTPQNTAIQSYITLRHIAHAQQTGIMEIIAAAEGKLQLTPPALVTRPATTMERFLNEGPTEQPCILALGEAVGDLHISSSIEQVLELARRT